ncbi:unnamed protein product, partial [marine sediment metagenome]
TAFDSTIHGRGSKPTCYRKVFAASAEITRVLKTRTNGWADLKLTVSYNAPSGSATLLARFNGTEYRVARVISCAWVRCKVTAKEHTCSRPFEFDETYGHCDAPVRKGGSWNLPWE